MKTGNVTGNVYKRSVHRKIGTNGIGVKGAEYGEGCAFLTSENVDKAPEKVKQLWITAQSLSVWSGAEGAKLCVYEAVNRAAAAAGSCRGLDTADLLRNLVILHHGRQNINVLRYCTASSRLYTGCRNHQRDVENLVVRCHVVFRHVAVLAEMIAVVGGKHQHRVLPHVVLVHHIENFTEVTVSHGHHSLAAPTQMLSLRLIKLIWRIGRMREVRTIVVAFLLVQIEIILRAVIRLMRVKRLYPQEIVIRVMIVLQPFRCMPHGLNARIVVLGAEVQTVFTFSFGPRALKPLRRRIRTNTVLTRTRPHRITFLTSVNLPCGKPFDIIFTTTDDIVRMIGKHLRMHILFTRKNALQALIKRLHCSPRFFKKVQPSGHDVAACGHARRRAAPVTVKHDGSPRQPINIRCDGRVLARTIRGQHASIECIAQNEDGFHVVPPLFLRLLQADSHILLCRCIVFLHQTAH